MHRPTHRAIAVRSARPCFCADASPASDAELSRGWPLQPEHCFRAIPAQTRAVGADRRSWTPLISALWRVWVGQTPAASRLPNACRVHAPQLRSASRSGNQMHEKENGGSAVGSAAGGVGGRGADLIEELVQLPRGVFLKVDVPCAERVVLEIIAGIFAERWPGCGGALGQRCRQKCGSDRQRVSARPRAGCAWLSPMCAGRGSGEGGSAQRSAAAGAAAALPCCLLRPRALSATACTSAPDCTAPDSWICRIRSASLPAGSGAEAQVGERGGVGGGVTIVAAVAAAAAIAVAA